MLGSITRLLSAAGTFLATRQQQEQVVQAEVLTLAYGQPAQQTANTAAMCVM